MIGRPQSPFKRSSRPPSRCGSPVRSAVISTAPRWAADESSNGGQGMSTAPSAYFAGPGTSPGGSPSSSAAPPLNDALPSKAEHYDVVLEGESAEAILPHLGTIVLDQSGSIEASDSVRRSPSDEIAIGNSTGRRGNDRYGASAAIACVDKYEAMLHELVQTEKSYVHRIEVLYQRYAVPLRQMARDRDTAIIPLYEAQRLFGNVGEILGANTAFLRELEGYVSNRVQGRTGSGELGEIIYRNIACFSCYNEYFGNFEKAKYIEQSMMRSNKSFRDFVERTKYSTAGLGNIGLRELIMEPIQRIPRYAMLLDGLMRNLPAGDPSRSRLEQAIVLAGRIASCEVDDKTKRAAVLWSFSRSVDGFPAGLISVHRQYIDCIDVDDFPIDVLGPAAMNTLMSPGGASSSGQHYRTLHCTLFLFDDVIAVVKRASSASCGRALVGLDDLNKLADQMKTFTERSAVLKSPPKVELGFRGLLDVSDVRAVDMGGPDFQLMFMRPPSHISGDKWSGRPVRQFATVDALSDQGPDPALARQEKRRFLDNLWRAQALYKTREHRSHVRMLVMPPATSTAEQVRRVVYYNVYARRAYLLEPRKADTVLHVDPDGDADPLPFGPEEAPPSASLRIHSLDDDTAFCTYVASFKGGQGGIADAGDVHQTPMASLPDELFRAAKQAHRATGGDFGPMQQGSPSTPGSSHRGRMLASGLEQFGRSIFGTPGSIRSAAGSSDFFGVRRTRSKGSSQASRYASTSTRMTHSTANTSSVGSRDMLGRSYTAAGRPAEEIQANIERYRNASPEMTPTKQSDLSQSPSGREGAASPLRRKPVPSSLATTTESPRRVPSGSKRELPSDATPTASNKPFKRTAHTRTSEEQDESVSPPPSPSPMSPPTSTLTAGRMSPVRHASLQPNGSTVAPLSIRKDKGQPRSLNREETMVKVQRDLTVLQKSTAASQALLEQARSTRDVRAIDECVAELETTQDAVGRLRDLTTSLASSEDRRASVTPVDVAAIGSKSQEVGKLEAQLLTLTRKCELLVALERDGRLENTELHKAFNEELDRMYDDAQLASGEEQVAKLRAEVRAAKAQRNEARLEQRKVQHELALERTQSAAWRATLQKHGLL